MRNKTLFADFEVCHDGAVHVFVAEFSQKNRIKSVSPRKGPEDLRRYTAAISLFLDDWSATELYLEMCKTTEKDSWTMRILYPLYLLEQRGAHAAA